MSGAIGQFSLLMIYVTFICGAKACPIKRGQSIAKDTLTRIYPPHFVWPVWYQDSPIQHSISSRIAKGHWENRWTQIHIQDDYGGNGPIVHTSLGIPALPGTVGIHEYEYPAFRKKQRENELPSSYPHRAPRPTTTTATAVAIATASVPSLPQKVPGVKANVNHESRNNS